MISKNEKKKKGFAGALGQLAAGGLNGFGAEDADDFVKAIAPISTPQNDEVARVEKIAVTLIDPSPDQVREVDREWVETLAHSIAEVGLDQPIKLRANPQSPGRYLLISGEHRWRAHIHAGLDTVDSIVVHNATDESSAISTLIENLLRKNLTPLQTAKSLRKVIDEHGYTYSKAAEKLGRSKTWVASHLSILQLPEPLRDAVHQKKLRDYTMIVSIKKLYEQDPVQVMAAIEEASALAPFSRGDLQRLENSLSSEIETAPVQRTDPVIETAPVQRTDPVIETAPVQRTDPVIETTPVQRTDPVIETTPVQRTDPVIETETKPRKVKRLAPAQVVVASPDGVELGVLILDEDAGEGKVMVRNKNGDCLPQDLDGIRVIRLDRQ